MTQMDWVMGPVALITVLLSLVGFFGLFLVFFPGLTVIWLGQLIWALFTGFNKGHTPLQFWVTVLIFVVNTLIMLFGNVIDNVFMAEQTHAKNTPWWVIGLAMLAMLVGGIVFSPLGGLALTIGLLYIVEYLRSKRDKQQAWEATKAWITGMGTAAIVRIALALLMIGLWLVVVVLL
ncbi:MAG: DUF456 domain-containing protein [Anaerolineaceae bacterium]|jgi:uncharacterized protein YqgC (DUF456 family)